MAKKNAISGKIEIEISGVKYTATVEFKEAPKAEAKETPKYKAWGVRIDRTVKDPEKAVEYIGDAQGYEPARGANPGSWDNHPVFNKIKPCLLKEGKVAVYLNPNDYCYTEGGSSVDELRDFFDTMVEFGKLYYRITQDSRYTYAEVTDDPASLAYGFTDYAYSYKGKVRDKFYIGAYKGVIKDEKLRSVFGELPTGNKTIGEFRKAAQANGTGYEILPFNKLTLLQVLYLIRYKSLDSRAALGKGVTESNEYKATGGADTDGLYSGSQDGTKQIKCHGIEDFYGNLLEWVDGFVSNNKIAIADGNFNDKGDGYEAVADLPETVYGGVITDVHGNNKLGFTPKTTDDDMCAGEGYYCNYGSTWTDDTVYLPLFGGARSSGAYAGAFYFYCDDSASNAYSTVGARLCFCGKE